MRSCGENGNQPLFNHTLMPTHMRGFFNLGALSDLQLAEPFSVTKVYQTLKTLGRVCNDPGQFGTLLFDIENDPAREHPLENKRVEKRMIEQLVTVMRENDAAQEQYQRLGLRN